MFDIWLRGASGRSIGEGRVEVYIDGGWGLICDSTWDKASADVACMQLGFVRGAQEIRKGSSGEAVGNSSGFEFALESVRCSGRESSIADCRHDMVYTCSIQNIANVKCHPNMGCEEGGVRVGQKCYHVVIDTDSTSFHSSQLQCENMGGSLATVTSQLESDFLSDVLYTYRHAHAFWIGGHLTGGEWLWSKGNGRTTEIEFTKWFPGFSPDGFNDKPSSLASYSHMSLARSFINANAKMIEVDYYYWTNLPGGGSMRLPYICEKRLPDEGCYIGKGEDYRGNASTTLSGKTCINWGDSTILDFVGYFADECAKLCTETTDFVCRSFTHTEAENRCRLSNATTADDVTLVPSPGSHYYELIASSENCTGMYVCNNGKCISQDEVCDAHNDCGDHSDESVCHKNLNTSYNM
ncbi:PREDICTED: uncharacterized protein LOC106807663 [Priapulus caudatus]|uniref:Uncharacterized protein LOC106807663 n=1 Tax=Priapulus caudatus TaxID=37621 RepID=A0ABM1E042_PRICU|nr:PREDICTED: uncharacterized protein LOC106807663 [Priapulus caudatus]